MKRMSFALTVQQVLDRSKTVTRREGWAELKVGDELLAVDRMVGGRVLATIRVVDVRVERWRDITPADVRREGFPAMTVSEFLDMACRALGVDRDAEVRRVAFIYLPS